MQQRKTARIVPQPTPRSRWRWWGWWVLVAASSTSAGIWLLDPDVPFSCKSFNGRWTDLRGFVENDPGIAVLLFFLLDVAVTALSLPCSALFAVAGGALFGPWLGTCVVCQASATGATIAFLASRRWFRPFVERHWGMWLVPIGGRIERDGPRYLLAMQLVPVFPFFLVNATMGLTRMPTRTFWLISQVGLLPGSYLYVNAGAALGRVASPREVLSPAVLGSLLLLGLVPLLARKALSWFSPRMPDSRPAERQQAVRLLGLESTLENRVA